MRLDSDNAYEDAVTDWLEGDDDAFSPDWYPGWRTPPSTFPGEQPVAIPGQLTLEDAARAEMIRRDRLARAEAIGRTIRPNYTGD